MWNSHLLRKMAGMDLTRGNNVFSDVQTRCWHSGTFFLLPLPVFSKAADGRIYDTGCRELNRFILPEKTDQEDVVPRTWFPEKETEMESEKYHSLLGNLVQTAVERTAWGPNFSSLSLFSQMFPFFLSTFWNLCYNKGNTGRQKLWKVTHFALWPLHTYKKCT